MQDPSNKADRYRKEAIKCHELAKTAAVAFLGDFYRRIAVRYLFMAGDKLRHKEGQGGFIRHRNESPIAEFGDGHYAARVDFELLARWAGGRSR